MASGKKKEKASKDKGSAPSFIALWVSRGRAVGALVGFVVVTWVSMRAGMGLTDAALRGLVGALAFSLVGWLCALLVITGLMRTAARDQVEGQRAAARHEQRAAQAQMAAAAGPAPEGLVPPEVAQ